jgi:hypothetical protein
MWVVADNGSKVNVYHSEYPYTSFQGPITLASNINNDDITAIAALPTPAPPKIGVLWSNQNTERYGFRVHRDGDAPGVWQADEVPASQSSVNVGNGMADDHLNLKVASDGTLYASVKTSYHSSKQPELALLVRRPNGRWDNLYQVDTIGTRPLVIVNEALDFLRVVYPTDTGGGNIVYRDSDLSHIGFGSRRTLISGTLNNPTTAKTTWTDEVIVMAAGHAVLIRETGVATTTTTLPGPVTTTTTNAPVPTTTTSVTPSSTTTTTAPGGTLAATIAADVSVVAGSSTTYGTGSRLEVDGSPIKNTFIRFTVAGTAGRLVTRAVLRLVTANTSGAVSDRKGVAHSASCDWVEGTLSGNTVPQPTIDPSILSEPPGPITASGQLVEFDVTGAVPGDGIYCVAIVGPITDGTDYNSREASSGKPTVTVTVAP